MIGVRFTGSTEEHTYRARFSLTDAPPMQTVDGVPFQPSMLRVALAKDWRMTDWQLSGVSVRGKRITHEGRLGTTEGSLYWDPADLAEAPQWVQGTAAETLKRAALSIDGGI